MSSPDSDARRIVGLYGATLVGIGGIIGGGLLILVGTAFNQAGPAAILAFVLNGIVAWLTAMSTAEISTAFPESGGAYTFAKKILSVRAAFAVGWVLWFAYIAAGVLYALGFARFTVILGKGACAGLGVDGSWLDGRNMLLFLATGATVLYSIGLVRKAAGGGQGVTVAKVVLFVLLGIAGVIALVRQPLSDIGPELSPFFDGGFDGLIAAMGFTFITLQGFEMVAAIAGEVKDPQRTIPRAMFLSLAISLAVYVPLLFLVATSGVDDGAHVMQLAAREPDTVVAMATREWLGEIGYWAMVATIAVATLSALQSNLLTASRVAFAMASDHTLPSVLEQRHPRRGTPIMAIYATALATVAIMFMIPDLASAGAAASLIFLLAFALTHATTYLARKRSGPKLLAGAYQTPYFPLVPVVGGVACAGLAVFQALAVPDAGGILLMWLALGVLLYFALFKDRAEAADSAAEALDPRLNLLRGKSPLVLLPVSRPASARSLVEVANALAPSEYARVLLLSIIRSARTKSGDAGAQAIAELADAQEAFRQALGASYVAGHAPEALITSATDPWPEIRRIADEHRCESLLLGLPRTIEDPLDRAIETTLNEVDCDVAMMSSSDDWRIGEARRVLVPILLRSPSLPFDLAAPLVNLAGKTDEHELRARLLATLCRELPRELVFVSVLPAKASDDEVATTARTLGRLADMNIPGTPVIEVVRSDDAAAAILASAARCDLVVLGMRRSRQGKKMLGSINRKVIAEAACAVMVLSRRGEAQIRDLARPIENVARMARDVVPIPFLPRRGEDPE